MIKTITQQFEELWGMEFTVKEEKEFKLIVPKDLNKSFPLIIGTTKIKNIHTDFPSLFEEENKNKIVTLWNKLLEIDNKRDPLLFLEINDNIYCVIKYTVSKSFFEDFYMNKNNIIINYKLSKLPRIYNSLIILEWSKFFDINNTYRKRQYIKKNYK